MRRVNWNGLLEPYTSDVRAAIKVFSNRLDNKCEGRVLMIE